MQLRAQTKSVHERRATMKMVPAVGNEEPCDILKNVLVKVYKIRGKWTPDSNLKVMKMQAEAEKLK